MLRTPLATSYYRSKQEPAASCLPTTQRPYGALAAGANRSDRYCRGRSRPANGSGGGGGHQTNKMSCPDDRGGRTHGSSTPALQSETAAAVTRQTQRPIFVKDELHQCRQRGLTSRSGQQQPLSRAGHRRTVAIPTTTAPRISNGVTAHDTTCGLFYVI